MCPSFLSRFVSHLALSFTLAGVQCPPRWACLRSCLPICLPSGFVSPFASHLALSFTLASPSSFVFHLGWGAVSASLGLSPVLSPNVSPNLSPIWLCLPVLSPHLFPIWLVFHLGWGAVSASLGLSSVLSPNLFPIWLCLSPWVGCCVRLAGLVSQFVSQFVFHLALSFTLAGVLCPPRWACLPICLLSGFAFHLGWGAVSDCLPICFPSGFGTQFSLPICFPSGFVFHLGWGAVYYYPTYLPTYLPTYNAPNCKSVGPSAVGPCPHFSCIAPLLNPPSTHPPLPYQLTTLSTLHRCLQWHATSAGNHEVRSAAKPLQACAALLGLALSRLLS